MRPVSDRFPVTQGFGSLATRGVVGSYYGTEVQYLVAEYGDYQPDGHNGADIGCPVGTPVYATRSGTVLLCDWDVNLPGDDSWSASGYFQRFAFFKRFGGRLLVVKVADNDYDVYAHLSAWKVGYGQPVSEGQLVALSGDSSAGMDGQLGPHLHTERIVDLTYSTGNGLIFGRTDPTPLWGGMAAMGGTITPLTQEDDMSEADVERIINETNTRTAQAQKSIEDTVRNLVAGVPLGVWSYSNPALGGGDAFQHVRDAVANTNGLAAELAKVAAHEAAGGSTEEQITAAVVAALQSGLKVDVTVNGGN